MNVRSNRVLPSIAAGFVAGIRTVIGSTALAALIFSNELAAGMPQGVAAMLITGGVLGAVIALQSSYAGTVGQPQDGPAVVLVLLGAAIVAALPYDMAIATKIGAVLAAISLASLLTGACFLAMGSLHLGRLVRFLPYPVVGGFIAGSGWLLFKGALPVLTGLPLQLSTIPALLTPDMVMHWAPAIVIALALFELLRRFNHFLIVPGTILAAGLLFYVALAVLGVPIAQARAAGWLLGPFPESGQPAFFTLRHLGDINVELLFDQWPKFATIVIVAAVQLLLNSTGLEFATKQDIDINRELRAAGIANLAGGLLGGAPGFQAMSASALGHFMGVNNRIIGLVSAALCLAALLVGTTALALVPKMLLGGLLMFMGISFLVEWLWRGWFRLPRQDYAVVLLIVGMTGLFGYLAGVATGIGAAMSIFVAACSKINVIKQAMTGAEYHSNVDRDPRSREILNERGRAVLVLKLDGFLFFGTVHGLVTHIQADTTKRTHLVIDFKDVVGMDSSAVKGLAKLYDHCRQRDCVLVLSGLSPQLRRDVANAGFDAVEAAGVHFFDDADQAMEACEDEILALATAGTKIAPIRWRDQLQSALSSQEKIGTFMAYLDMRDYEGGEILIRQGEQARDMFFIESGRITARLELGAGKAMRLRTMGGGTTVGEIGCYLGQTRTASIVADVPTRAYRLSAEALRQMEERDPDLAAALHRYMVALLADRLSATASLLRKVLS